MSREEDEEYTAQMWYHFNCSNIQVFAFIVY